MLRELIITHTNPSILKCTEVNLQTTESYINSEAIPIMQGLNHKLLENKLLEFCLSHTSWIGMKYFRTTRTTSKAYLFKKYRFTRWSVTRDIVYSITIANVQHRSYFKLTNHSISHTKCLLKAVCRKEAGTMGLNLTRTHINKMDKCMWFTGSCDFNVGQEWNVKYKIQTYWIFFNIIHHITDEICLLAIIRLHTK